ncbi:MAG: amidohydrolase family protein [Alphaproteobacteria bacterium]|nr:amidohydrolase family protein [Alphaproteobacteria bacterium]
MKTVFVGGLVFDGSKAPAEGLGVVVENGRIARVAPAGEFSGFSGKRVDTAGMTLMPGLIDCHVHLVLPGEANLLASFRGTTPQEAVMRVLELAQATLRGGFTSIRDLGGRDYLEIAVRDAFNAGHQLGPTLHCAGKVICMTGGHGWFLGREADGPLDVAKAVRENIKAGADHIKFIATGGVATPNVDPMLAQLTLEELTAGVAEAKRFNRKSTAHAQGAPGIKNAVEAGVGSIEHGFQLTDEIIEEMKKRNVYLVATLASMDRTLSRPDVIPAYMREKAQRFCKMHQDSVIRFYKAGGKLAMGTDAGTPFNFHGENSQELKHLVDLGVTPLDAIRSATGNAADLIGFTDRGRIAEGSWADLLLVQGNPAKDIAAASDRANHRLVLKNGIDVHATLGAPIQGPAPRFPKMEPPTF